MKNVYCVVKEFENKISEFTGSKYAVAVDNCTNAIFLCCKYLNVSEVTIPKRTYVSVASTIIHSGGKIKFHDNDWDEKYFLKPYPIVDSACCLKKNMYEKGTYTCISFSANKPINIGKGGMILTDNQDAYNWFKLARYCGRSEVPLYEENDIHVLGWNMYMTPEQAARGLNLLMHLGEGKVCKNKYPDLSKFSVFKNT